MFWKIWWFYFYCQGSGSALTKFWGSGTLKRIGKISVIIWLVYCEFNWLNFLSSLTFFVAENSCKVDGGYTGVRDVYQVRQMDR